MCSSDLFLERLDDPAKNWKFSVSDARERGHWDAYMAAYEDMIRNTATKEAPWWVVPADNKWFTRVVVCAAVIETLAGLDLAYPSVSAAARRQPPRSAGSERSVRMNDSFDSARTTSGRHELRVTSASSGLDAARTSAPATSSGLTSSL